MRVITGTARGMKLITLEGLDVRPTTDRVKEALFSSLQFELEGRRVLDLFAGSGQLGIEALSRGAKSATFIDASDQAVQVVKQNLVSTKLFSLASVVVGDYASFLEHTRNVYDIVFIDPPYGRGLAAKALGLAVRVVPPQGVIICETAKIDPMPESEGAFVRTQKKDYGKTSLSIYRMKDVE